MRPNGQGTDVELLARMREGDEAAFLALYRRFQGPLFRFGLQMTGNAGLAEEVVQEAFMTLVREATSFDPARGSLPSYLYGICRNHILRCLAAERAYSGFDPDEPDGPGSNMPAVETDPLAGLEAAERVDRVRRAVLSLPTAYREVVVLCELSEMSYEKASELLGCPIGTVRSRLHRARELLHAKLTAYNRPKAALGPASRVQGVGRPQ